MKFTFNPMPGEAGFTQWKTAMKALTRLPGGVPKEFRKSVIICLNIYFSLNERIQLILISSLDLAQLVKKLH